jgi:AmiR/NasT family two-component response regulator
VILADMATSYLVQARELDRQTRLIGQLSRALDSRILIEQAKGVLAARTRTTVAEAFDRMRSHARGTGTQLTTVADWIIRDDVAVADLTRQSPPGS